MRMLPILAPRKDVPICDSSLEAGSLRLYKENRSTENLSHA